MEDGRVPAKDARSCRIEGQKKRTTRKEYQRLLNKFEVAGFMAQKGLWNLVGEKVLRDRGALPKEEGDVIREEKATNADKFLSSWWREDGKTQGRKNNGHRHKEETSNKRMREKERGENETGCFGFGGGF